MNSITSNNHHVNTGKSSNGGDSPTTRNGGIMRTILVNGTSANVPAAYQTSFVTNGYTIGYSAVQWDSRTLEPCDGCDRPDVGYRDPGDELLCGMCRRGGLL